MTVYGDEIYGEAVNYGGDVAHVVPKHPSGCVCGDVWRFEACDLRTGQVKAVLHPLSVDWEDRLSDSGSGSMLVATRDYRAVDIYPHRTSIYISRLFPDGTREGHYGGYVEKYSGSSGGATTIGLQGIDEYLNHRNLANDVGGLEYRKLGHCDGPTTIGREQVKIASDFVNLAKPHGIPLTPLFELPSIRRELRYRPWEFKNLGDALADLIQLADGVEYQLEHLYANGFWRTVIRFADHIGVDRNIILKSDREGSEYSVDVDAKDHATWVYAVGEGEELVQKTAIAYDIEDVYPRFHAAPAWKDESVQDTLNQHAVGYVVDHRDPLSTPGMTIAGLDPDPSVLKMGDRVFVDIDYGLVRFNGYARVLAQGWRIGTDNPVTRELTFQPEGRPFTAGTVEVTVPVAPPPTTTPTPTTPPPTSPPSNPNPEPKAGLIATISSPSITESSGAACSKAHPGVFYTHNDEIIAPQIYAISINTGNIMGKFTFSPNNLPASGDPESIRVDWVTGQLYLADIGDNFANRASTIGLYRISEPALGNHSGPATRLPLHYPGGTHYNAEALLIDPILGMANAYIITKAVSGSGKLFKLPNPLNTSSNLLIDQHKAMPAQVSDATFTMNGKWALLRVASDNVHVYNTVNWTQVGLIATPHVFQGESITAEPDGRSFLTTSEEKHAPGVPPTPIYRTLIPTQFR